MVRSVKVAGVLPSQVPVQVPEATNHFGCASAMQYFTPSPVLTLQVSPCWQSHGCVHVKPLPATSVPERAAQVPDTHSCAAEHWLSNEHWPLGTHAPPWQIVNGRTVTQSLSTAHSGTHAPVAHLNPAPHGLEPSHTSRHTLCVHAWPVMHMPEHGSTHTRVTGSQARPPEQSPLTVHCGRHEPASHHCVDGQSAVERHCAHAPLTQNCPGQLASPVHCGKHAPCTHAMFAPQSVPARQATQRCCASHFCGAVQSLALWQPTQVPLVLSHT